MSVCAWLLLLGWLSCCYMYWLFVLLLLFRAPYLSRHSCLVQTPIAAPSILRAACGCVHCDAWGLKACVVVVNQSFKTWLRT